jgi:hypothetical protein
MLLRPVHRPSGDGPSYPSFVRFNIHSESSLCQLPACLRAFIDALTLHIGNLSQHSHDEFAHTVTDVAQAVKKVRTPCAPPQLVRHDSIIHYHFDVRRGNRASLASGNVCLTKNQQETS